MNPKRVGPVVLLLLVMSGGYWWWQTQQTAAAKGLLVASGTIEATEITLASELNARIVQLTAAEGAAVTKGQPLVLLDTALLDAQIDQAKANVAVAQANLALLKAGARPEELEQSQAAVTQIEALVAGAQQAYEHAQAALANPQALNLQVAQAKAARDAAQKALDKLQASARSEDVTAAQAGLNQAQANAQSTHDRLSTAKTQADAAVEQAANAVRAAQQAYTTADWNNRYAKDKEQDPLTGRSLNDFQLQQYQVAFDNATLALQNAENNLELAKVAADQARQAEATGNAAADQQVSQAQSNLDKLNKGAANEDIATARTALTNAQRSLDLVQGMRADPQQLQAGVDSAKAQLDNTKAQLAQAQARLTLTQSGSRSEQIQIAEAQITAVQAGQRQLEVQRAKATISAPRDGVVLNLPVHEGELVVPGGTLLSVADLSRVEITVYVPEDRYGAIKLGANATVHVDSYPDKTFTATVQRIANQAEFTPRNVQTVAGRKSTVYAVTLNLSNPDSQLKPGMPADVTF